ncbi:hypothetical protein LWI28_024935 [Acer negundo]|uniref:Uncharacterized protein n=1 Tax=Acer negundo TaxID=4023 RepID=A0AAD5P4Y4_ACENE|nr:hypothetical protein LWI28_024935 [Acer negundo]KAK4858895.1 hypothetical protein QYF36_023551 [Acer negundo]
MLSICPLVSRLSLATRTGATRLLKGKTIPALVNSGVEANRIIGTRTFSVKSDNDSDDGSGGSRNRESNDSIPPHFNSVSFLPSFAISNPSKEDFEVIVEWFHINKENDAFLGGRHGKMVEVKVNSQMLEVPSGILPCCIKESDKEEIYRLHMEDQLVNTLEKLAKVYNTAAETVNVILILRDALNCRKQLQNTEKGEMYRLYMENPEIYTIERLAKDFGVAKGSAHVALFGQQLLHNPPWLKSSASHCGETHRLPLTGVMKADLERWSAGSNVIFEERKIGMEFKNRRNRMFIRRNSFTL